MSLWDMRGVSGPPPVNEFMGQRVTSMKEIYDMAENAGMNKKDIADMLGGLFKASMIPIPQAPMPPPLPASNVLSNVTVNTPSKPPAWLQRDEWGGIDSSNGLLRMLAMRLRLGDGQMFPFEFIMPCRTKEKVVIFLIINGEPTHVEDDWNMYPSDTLITKLRLIAQ
jgi:hypothetical protein